MIIGIDGNEANVTKRVGISEFAYQLLMQLSSSKFKDQNIKYVIYLKNEPLDHMPKWSKNWHYRVITPGKLWTQWRLPLDLYMHKPRPDVFFSPSHYAPRFSPVPSVISVMDLSYLKFPDMFDPSDLYQLRNWTAYSVKQAKKVITISNSSRDDIIKAYKISQDKVATIYPGIKPDVSLEPRVYAMNQLAAKYHLSKNYILFVGTLQPRKNITRLIEAFAQLKEQSANDEKHEELHDLQLVIIGKKGWLYEEILDAPAKYGVENSVKFLHTIKDEELKLFYKNALCYVLPSLYEGFGLPVVEAMKQGCPVITSNISSMPEAGGDAAVYVNPQDVSDISEKIRRVVSDKELRKSMVEKGKKQITKFSWEKSAKETLAVLKEVAGQK